MRVASPVESGHLLTQGFRIYYEVFGEPGAPAVLLLPTWQISPSLHWKLQVPYLGRSFRVVTFDPPGIGGAERTEDPAAFELDRAVDYGVDLLDRFGISRADVVGLSMGGAHGLWMAGRYPERVTRLVLISTVSPEWAFGEDPAFWQRRDTSGRHHSSVVNAGHLQTERVVQAGLELPAFSTLDAMESRIRGEVNAAAPETGRAGTPWVEELTTG